jgi:hypothetical protein
VESLAQLVRLVFQEELDPLDLMDLEVFKERSEFQEILVSKELVVPQDPADLLVAQEPRENSVRKVLLVWTV